jgi:hypothetical protein
MRKRIRNHKQTNELLRAAAKPITFFQVFHKGEAGEKTALKGREAVKVEALTASRGVSSKWLVIGIDAD